jgi:hypothetical protein
MEQIRFLLLYPSATRALRCVPWISSHEDTGRRRPEVNTQRGVGGNPYVPFYFLRNARVSENGLRCAHDLLRGFVSLCEPKSPDLSGRPMVAGNTPPPPHQLSEESLGFYAPLTRRAISRTGPKPISAAPTKGSATSHSRTPVTPIGLAMLIAAVRPRPAQTSARPKTSRQRALPQTGRRARSGGGA